MMAFERWIAGRHNVSLKFEAQRNFFKALSDAISICLKGRLDIIASNFGNVNVYNKHDFGPMGACHRVIHLLLCTFCGLDHSC
jgi:hypothetical protein